MTKAELYKKKCIRIENERVQHTGSFSHTRSNGYQWQIYICTLLFEPFNPYLKGNKGRDYKIFYSSVSSSHCKDQAWEYIKQNT